MTSPTLIKSFGFPFKGFSNPVEWIDGDGFSVVKERDSKFASILKIGISGSRKDDLIPLWITISYGRNSENGITLASGEKGLEDPIDLDFYNEFTYDESKELFYYRDKEISAHEIISRIENAHIRPTRKFYGIFLRLKLWFWRKLLLSLIKSLDSFLISLLWLISGEKIEGDPFKRFLNERFFENKTHRISLPRTIIENTEIIPGGIISFFGYQAKRRSVILYCLIHLILYSIYFYKEAHFAILGGIFKNNFLSLCYIIISFSILDFLIPEILKRGIKVMPYLYGKISFKRLRVNI